MAPSWFLMPLQSRRTYLDTPVLTIVKETDGGDELIRMGLVYKGVVLLFAPNMGSLIEEVERTNGAYTYTARTLRLPKETQPIGVRLLLSWMMNACRTDSLAMPPVRNGDRFHETICLHHSLKLFGMKTEAANYEAAILRTVSLEPLDVAAIKAIWETMPADSEIVNTMIRKTAARFANRTMENFGDIDEYTDTQPELRRRLDEQEWAISDANNLA